MCIQRRYSFQRDPLSAKGGCKKLRTHLTWQRSCVSAMPGEVVMSGEVGVHPVGWSPSVQVVLRVEVVILTPVERLKTEVSLVAALPLGLAPVDRHR